VSRVSKRRQGAPYREVSTGNSSLRGNPCKAIPARRAPRMQRTVRPQRFPYREEFPEGNSLQSRPRNASPMRQTSAIFEFQRTSSNAQRRTPYRRGREALNSTKRKKREGADPGLQEHRYIIPAPRALPAGQPPGPGLPRRGRRGPGHADARPGPGRRGKIPPSTRRGSTAAGGEMLFYLAQVDSM
jgi:hypothetical protein